MQNILTTLIISFLTFILWMPGIFALSKIQSLDKPIFIVLHLLIIVTLYGAGFGIYYKYFAQFSPIITMIIAMTAFFIIEAIFYVFIYDGDFWFLNFWDFILPIFILASTIYFAGRMFE